MKSPAATSPDDLLTCADVAPMFRRSVDTIARMAARGELPVAQKLPGRTGAYLFRRADVDALLTAASA